MEALLSLRATEARSSVIRDLLRLVDRPGVLSLAGGLPAGDCFPVERIRAAADRALSEASGPLGLRALQYGTTEGDRELRELIAGRAGVAVERVLITAGSQQGLDLVGRALLDPGDPVVVEQPGYVGAIQALRTCGPQLVGVEIDRDGLRIERLAELLAGGLRPKLVYCVPNFQNPTGAVLSAPRRIALLELAERYGFLVVEDDPYGELGFGGEPPPSLAALGGPVVSLGSSSKILAPGLRVGWVIAPEPLVGALVRLKQAADLHTSALSQRIVLELLGDEAFLGGHIDRIRTVYAERAEALFDALPSVVRAARPLGGLFLWADAPEGTDTTAALARAVDAGVAFVPGSAFSLDEAPSASLRLSFSALDPTGLRLAAERLALAFARDPART